MKVIVEHPSERVIGMHMLGTDAPEIVQGFAAAMQAGLSKAQLDATTGIHGCRSIPPRQTAILERLNNVSA